MNTDLDKLKEMLEQNPAALEDAQKRFEKSFGKNSNVRTAKQWQNLVRVYGMKQVMETEKLTEAEINARCKSFSQKVMNIYSN